jgi:hypothetical protein
MSSAALASLEAAAAADRAAHVAGFSPTEAASGLIATDELARTQGGGTAASAGVSPAALQAVAADLAPLTLLQLPAEVLVLVLSRLDAFSLARFSATCSELFREPMTPVEEALRQRAAECGHVCPARLPHGFSSWPAHLAWLERRRDTAWARVAAGSSRSFFVAQGGRLMSCGTEKNVCTGVLGHGELDSEDRVLRTATLLPSTACIRIRSVAAGYGFSAAVSAAGAVYTLGKGDGGRLGHSDEERSLVPKRVQALAGHRVLSVAAGYAHCLAVKEREEIFSWGWDF